MSDLINDCKLPYPIWKAMCNDPYSNKGADYSVSSLFNGPKQILGDKRLVLLSKLKETKDKSLYEQLKLLFPNQLTLPYEQFNFDTISIPKKKASEQLALFDGSMFHDGIEHRLQSDPEFKTEIRMFLKVRANNRDVLISGAFDCYCIPNNTLYDYKTTAPGGWKWRAKKLLGYGQQVNIYRLLMKLNNIANPQQLVIIFIVKGWNELDAKSYDYPPQQYMEEEIQLQSDHEVVELIKEKITLIESYKDTPLENIPYCTPEQRWESDPIWKICKKKKDGSIPVRPRAVPNGKFESEEAAQLGMRKRSSDYFIHEESGMPKRCFKYCSVYKAGLCDYPEVWTFNRSEDTETNEIIVV